MNTTYLPRVSHILPLTTVRRELRLPVPGTVTVQVNERVQATDVVAEAEVDPRHYFIDIARGLGVSEREVPRYLNRRRGERMEAGDVIAGPVGLARRTVRAPVDGLLVAVSEGRVLFETRGKQIEIEAGFPGNVVSTDGANVVVIEATAALVQGSWGNGRQSYGAMRMVVETRDGMLDNARLDLNLRGAVLVAGKCDHPSPLNRATDLTIKGLILGSASSELIPILRRLPYPVIVLDGFGDLPMNSAAYNLLETNAGREVSLDARMGANFDNQRPELIIPLPSSHDVDLPDEVVPLAEGVRVRIVRNPSLGMVGVVREMLPSAVSYPSGILARSVLIDLDAGEMVSVPVANLEVLQ